MIDIIVAMVGFVALIIAVIFLLWMKKGGLLDLGLLVMRGGSLVMRVFPDNSIDFKVSRKPINNVKFGFKDEKGRKGEVMTRITGIRHHLLGTSRPIHVCVMGRNENISILEENKMDKSAEYMNQWGISAYQTGYNDGRALKDMFGKGSVMDKTVIFIIILVILMFVLMAMNWQIMELIGKIPGIQTG